MSWPQVDTMSHRWMNDVTCTDRSRISICLLRLDRYHCWMYAIGGDYGVSYAMVHRPIKNGEGYINNLPMINHLKLPFTYLLSPYSWARYLLSLTSCCSGICIIIIIQYTIRFNLICWHILSLNECIPISGGLIQYHIHPSSFPHGIGCSIIMIG